MIEIGTPCKYGHDGARYVKSGACVTCARARVRREAANLSEDERIRRKEYGRTYHSNKSEAQRSADKERHRNWSKSERGKERRRGYWLKRMHGIGPDEFQSRVAEQGNACAICTKNASFTRFGILCVDHDHETGKVRQLLCDDCNVGLGQFKDRPDLIDLAAAYLRRHGKEG